MAEETVQVRLVAVSAANKFGYTRLIIAADEEGSLARMKASI